MPFSLPLIICFGASIPVLEIFGLISALLVNDCASDAISSLSDYCQLDYERVFS